MRLHRTPCTATSNASLDSVESVNKPDFVVADDKRPSVDDYGNDSKYSPGDQVYLCVTGEREGPYKVETVETGRYTLCDDSGISVKSGQAYDEVDLELYDPFA